MVGRYVCVNVCVRGWVVGRFSVAVGVSVWEVGGLSVAVGVRDWVGG